MSPTTPERPAREANAKRKPVGDGDKLSILRTALGWSRSLLARVMNASDRALVNWEAGDPISPVYAAKLREIQSIYNELKRLMKPDQSARGC